MKMFKIIFFVILVTKFSFPQGEAAVPFLLLNPSPQFQGLGQTGVALPNDDAFGFYYNPANLGFFGNENNFAAHFYSNPVNWLGFTGIKINGYALNAGYNFSKELGINLSAGIGYIHSRMSFGSFMSAPGRSFESYDEFDAFGLGVLLDYGVMFSAGITYKNIYSKLNDNPIAYVNQSAELSTNAFDYGFLINVPLFKLLYNDFYLPLSLESKLLPTFNYMIGYSRSNIGNEVYYIDPAQSDPLPLTARLGHTFKFGFDLMTNQQLLNLINYNLILEVEDILIEKKPGEINYQGLFGDIDFDKNFIGLKGDEKVVVHKGHLINIMETVSILIGSYHGRGYYNVFKTDGFIINSTGIFKVLNILSQDELIEFIAKHIELKYISSTNDLGLNFTPSDFSGIALSLKNFTF